MKRIKNQRKVPAWAKHAARAVAKDGLKNGWPTPGRMKGEVGQLWGKIIDDALRFYNSPLWKELGLGE